MSKSAYDTVKIVMFFDKLFDSLNGKEGRKRTTKPLRSAVLKTSSHVSFWKEAIKSFRNMHFQGEGTKERNKPPSLSNFIITLEGFNTITEKIFSMKFQQYYARKLNRDALENFFSQIRQHRGRLSNPTCGQFSESYKSLFFRHMARSHGRMANCEQTHEIPLVQFNDVNNVINDKKDHPIIEEPRIHIKFRSTLTEIVVEPRIIEFLLENLTQTIHTQIKCSLCHLHIFNGNLGSVPPYPIGQYQAYLLHCIKQTYNICMNILNTENVTNNIAKTITVYMY